MPSGLWTTSASSRHQRAGCRRDASTPELPPDRTRHPRDGPRGGDHRPPTAAPGRDAPVPGHLPAPRSGRRAERTTRRRAAHRAARCRGQPCDGGSALGCRHPVAGRGAGTGRPHRADVLAVGEPLRSEGPPHAAADEDRTRRGALPVTTPARTWRDLAAVLTPPALLAVTDQFQARWVTRDELARQLWGRPTGRGSARAREVLPIADPRAESPMESVLRWLLHEAGLPAPDLQYVVRDVAGLSLGRADLAWPDREGARRVRWRRPPRAGRVRQRPPSAEPAGCRREECGSAASKRDGARRSEDLRAPRGDRPRAPP